jgi:hypothetical protein
MLQKTFIYFKFLEACIACLTAHFTAGSMKRGSEQSQASAGLPILDRIYTMMQNRILFIRFILSKYPDQST